MTTIRAMKIKKILKASTNDLVTFTGENDEEAFVLSTNERCFVHIYHLIAVVSEVLKRHENYIQLPKSSNSASDHVATQP